jgi:hypothetical protein
LDLLPSMASTTSTSTSGTLVTKRAIITMIYLLVSTSVSASTLRRHYDCRGMLVFASSLVWPSVIFPLRLRGC